MNRKYAIIFTAGAGIALGAGLLLSEQNDAPKSLEQQIDDKCHQWANKVRSGDQHISNKFNGCRIAFMENTPSLQEKGTGLANSLQENSEILQYRDAISLCLKGFGC